MRCGCAACGYSELSCRPRLSIIPEVAIFLRSWAMSKSWTITKARAKLDKLIETAGSHGPQTITKNGRAAAIVFSPQAWRPRRTEHIGTLVDFFATSPLRNSGLKIPREKRTL